MFERTSGFGFYEYYQDDTEIDKKQIDALMEAHPEAQQLWIQSKKASTIAWVFTGVQAGFTIWLLTDLDEINSFSDLGDQASFWASLGSGIVSGIFTTRFKKKRKEAILKYNQRMDGAFYFAPSDHNIGVTMHF